MTMYEQVLGEQFERLHKRMQQRYRFNQATFIGKGKMDIVENKWWLRPFLYLATKRRLMFPEHGKNIPFEVKNTLNVEKNEVYWERKFFIGGKVRYFDANMKWNEQTRVVDDFLGYPSPLYSSLCFQVQPCGGLKIVSGRQALLIGKHELEIPSFLQVKAEVYEQFDEKIDRFRIKVKVRNRLIGTLFTYEGTFIDE
ncbi:DUF4166 domain-containing protein [Cytobacillus sp. Sa5YUA1]|uniref:DUF4166 domain-containing protein n=1 Tax=Cytobacillus stercorigallinarum TaxID=2762240 RepID=A0ABR8QLY1_9BACI|nr:DUF4166 domain-containing protein [Cytobacillus stercorigallinarum]MBD7936533.1 DUF4166 domain-containing protein [Cytobacillus stercorigallinarum]